MVTLKQTSDEGRRKWKRGVKDGKTLITKRESERTYQDEDC
jgi:hypothetical protein